MVKCGEAELKLLAALWRRAVGRLEYAAKHALKLLVSVIFSARQPAVLAMPLWLLLP